MHIEHRYVISFNEIITELNSVHNHILYIFTTEHMIARPCLEECAVDLAHVVNSYLQN